MVPALPDHTMLAKVCGAYFSLPSAGPVKQGEAHHNAENDLLLVHLAQAHEVGRCTTHVDTLLVITVLFYILKAFMPPSLSKPSGSVTGLETNRQK